MNTDRDFADLCAASYAPLRDTYAWDARIFVSEVRAFVKHYPWGNAVVFTGTDDTDQWVRDFTAIPRTTSHPTLGVVHAGFYSGMEAATAEIIKTLRPDELYWITGHSLGAAHAWLFAGLMLSDQQAGGIVPAVRPPSGVITFGSPKPTLDSTLRTTLAQFYVVQRSYRNAPDPAAGAYDRVTDLAFTVPPFLTWQQPVGLTDINAPPPASDTSDWRYHHIELYQQGAPA